MPRLDIPAALTAKQTVVCDEVIAGRRGKVPAPMIAWLRNPELARRSQMLGELLRYETNLTPNLTELAILVCGRHWTSHVEWKAHKAMGLKAGLSPDAIDAIAARAVPNFDDERERVVYEVSSTLLRTGRVPAALYSLGIQTLGETALVELVGVLGYYCLVSLTLNTFELGLPESVAPELEDPDYAVSKRQRDR